MQLWKMHLFLFLRKGKLYSFLRSRPRAARLARGTWLHGIGTEWEVSNLLICTQVHGMVHGPCSMGETICKVISTDYLDPPCPGKLVHDVKSQSIPILGMRIQIRTGTLSFYVVVYHLISYPFPRTLPRLPILHFLPPCRDAARSPCHPHSSSYANTPWSRLYRR
ncbi:hypothetical protein SODALDRAFT_148143 [Sodiomyces alkalinus F11]|uniref:Uncharacterized protein n=1 Tax=Sodiomyces alkalinus (strain CBS 110278 / VKM F-3762 / F11) TaxID=1314773 RepID=A0A3N2PWJ7_SODAK|nr:hypothetical protein SODALDRAFT_148143 [Sodiomyces alkalinus F11]ROT38893.1 hypothetical protein SODALDRAFT_148143 [Sodiomyces alkalinus F11]